MELPCFEPSSAEEYAELQAEHLQQYESGVDCFISGDWEAAYRHLHSMPAGDQAQDFLMLQIAQHNRTAPPDWDGIIRFTNK